MKVALIHDHLAQAGGAEKVLEVLARLFPEAPIYTLLYEKKNVENYFKERHIETSIIQKLPGGVKHYKWYLPLMPLAVEFYDLRNYDVVISDTASFAKGVITPPDTLHLCYCHTPTRYLWSDTHEYINELKYGKIIKKIISLTLNRLRIWDLAAAARVDYFIANSKIVQKRIKKYYRRDSVVIYPPVETTLFSVATDFNASIEPPYYLAGCRLVPYKRLDILIEAFLQLGSSYRLKIFGSGPDEARLRHLAGKAANIEFLGRVSDSEKAKLYRYAQAFINPQEEDFGITPVEAMASGRPVIAYNKGGVVETVIPDQTGIFFDEQTPAAIMAAVKKAEQSIFNPLKIRAQAEKFSVAIFKQQIEGFISAKRAE